MCLKMMGTTQWGWSDMEELLQCPVCFEPPAQGVVEQCKSGHHICSKCKTQVESCPLCKGDYPGTRNFIVEELMRNLETIKNTMLLSELVSQAQTPKNQNKDIPALKPTPKVSLPPAPIATKGHYPCAVCEERLPSSRLLNHVRAQHPLFLEETSLNDQGIFRITFNLINSCTMPLFKWHKVLFISGMGLVFFTYVLLKSGYWIATVQMAAKHRICQKWKCLIKFKNPRGPSDFQETFKLSSTRGTIENVLYKEECLLLTKKQLKPLRDLHSISCTVELSLVKETDQFGSNYTRLGRRFMKTVLSDYTTHEPSKKKK